MIAENRALCSHVPARALAVTVALLAGATAGAQEASPAVQTPAELLEALRAAGVEIPGDFTANEDGTVSLPAPPAPPAVDAAVPVGDDARLLIDPPAPEPEFKAEWDHKIDFALNLTDGNTETASLRLGYEGSRIGRRNETTWDAAYFYSENDGNTDQNRATAGINNDFLLGDESPWILFAGLRGDYDQFDNFNYRVILNAGVGYKLIDKDDLKLTLRAG